MVDAGGAAARFLLSLGYTPLLKADTLDALYARGGADAALARHLFELVEGDT
jgi:hypothetical protein